MGNDKIVPIEDRIPKLKSERKQRANRRLILYLSLFFFLILVVIYFQSSLSHVTTIKVNGNIHVSDELIIKKSGITEGTSIWKIDIEQIEDKLTNEMSEIASVSVERKLPNSMQVTVTEHSRVAYLFNDGKYYPILNNGSILSEMGRGNFPTDAPLLVGWSNAEVEELAAELSKLPESLINRISEIYFTPSKSDPLRITLYMNDGYEVSSTIRHFSEKIAAYPAIVEELQPDEKGIIHMKMNPYFEKFNFEEETEIESEG